MAASNILIVGAAGLGVEIAKNVILAGVKSVTLLDDATVVMRDLSAQFYLTEADVGKKRAAACKDRLQELNTAVAVSVAAGWPSDRELLKYQVVVLTDTPLADALRVDELCHRAGIGFICANIRGVFARVFCDFGPAFTVFDVDGEEPVSGIVAGITGGSPTIVTCVEDERLEFQDGQLVTFTEVVGMTELSDGKPRRIRNCKAHSFELEEDTSSYSAYVRGGIVTQHKEPKQLAFKPLAAAIAEPGEFLASDFAKMEQPAQLHLAFQALDAFQAEEGRLPAPHDKADAAALMERAHKLRAAQGGQEPINQELLEKVAYTAAGELSPMAAIIGGCVGQEVIKAVSGKFHPIFQWFYFDAVEALPAELPLPAAEVAGKGGRHDAQVAVFGRSVQAKLEAQRLFLVGAGALGCEFLKAFAMMGIAAGGGGSVTVTDDDVIEKSNLSRQFLFRDWNIGSAKSSVAAAAACALNPAMVVRALQNRVSPDTEAVFDDAFWEGLDCVVNALDNVNARLYVDSRCVYFGKPLLESGTLGPKCNTQTVIPRLTENYGASRDPPEKQAPMCTVHSFPHNIDHCLTFARSEFEGFMEKAPAEANAFLADPTKYIAAIRQASDAAAREQLERVVEVLVTERCSTMEDCIEWARKKFQMHFHDRIAQLVYTFPEDAPTSTGALFWSAPKRFPRALDWSAADPSHVAFVQAAALLRAEVYGIAPPAWARDPAKMAEAAAAVHVEPFMPRSGVHVETDPKATTASRASAMGDDEGVIDEYVKRLEAALKVLPAGFHLNPITFEKDDDTKGRWGPGGGWGGELVLDWFKERGLEAYSMSCGQSLLYNNIFPKHRERLGKKMSELVGTVAKMEIPERRQHFDVVVACEDEEGEDLDVPLVSIRFR
ncbi:hypothetical protein WJX81_003279 [Elliptochloris bilobata]|uniref:E1 ubiquitin-activating enzyme n=1 Tax=Elliptochloris bilobata TaxID=381761 RepID=A0AAW1R0A1_9CHLO